MEFTIQLNYRTGIIRIHLQYSQPQCDEYILKSELLHHSEGVCVTGDLQGPQEVLRAGF